MEKCIIYGLNNLSNVVLDFKDFVSQLKGNTFAFVGPIGVGKTTLIKKILASYGIEEAKVISPTFNYVNVYKAKDGQKVYHFDLYRLENSQDFFDAGFDEFLYDDEAIKIIEWPEIINDHLKGNAILCKIDYLDENKRELTLKPL